jgi:hypothetical protein
MPNGGQTHLNNYNAKARATSAAQRRTHSGVVNLATEADLLRQMFNGNSAAGGQQQSNTNIQVEAKNRSATDNGKVPPALV